jgi:hypothetical protein
MTVVEQINSVGPPPERHPNRVVAGWLRHMAERNARVTAAIDEISRDPHVRDGCPKAQKRLEQKLKAAGATHTILNSGKRGRYSLSSWSWIGWDRVLDQPIKIDDDIPDKPWVASYCYEILGMGHCRMRFASYSPLMISHHALSRCVQRWEVITLPELEKVVQTIGTVGLTAIGKLGLKSDNWHKTPDCGIRIPFPGGKSVMVLQGHETRTAMVVATIMNNV